MKSLPKIINAKSYPDRSIEIEYSDGLKKTFNFEHYFEYSGYYDFLKDSAAFLKLNIDSHGHFVFWINEQTQEEIELDPQIMHSICSNEKILHNNKVVFDPALGKNGWL